MTTPVEKPQLQFVRDMFIFSTFTGLAYADLKRLSDKDITQAGDGTWWIHIHRKKTDDALFYPSAGYSSSNHREIPRPKKRSDKMFNVYCRGYLI